MITKIFNNNDELLALVKEKEGIKYIDFERQNIECEFDIMLGRINIINSGYIRAWSITAWSITAHGNITAEGDIAALEHITTEGKITAHGNITALGHITAWDIAAHGDIAAQSITAQDISYHALCFAHNSFICKSIKGTRENSKHLCLNSEIKFI